VFVGACGSDGPGDGPADLGPDDGALDGGRDGGDADAAPGDAARDAGDGGVGWSVGPEGGTVEAAGGFVQLVFPPGAVPSSIDVTVERRSTFPPAAGLIDARVYEIGPEGARFSKPVELTLGYELDELPVESEESELILYVLDGEEWTAIPGSEADVVEHAVTATVAHFSTHAAGRPEIFYVPGDGFSETFVVTKTLVDNTCRVPYVPDPMWRVTIGDGTLTFGLGTGTYDGGIADGEYAMTIPIRPRDECYAQADITWSLVRE